MTINVLRRRVQTGPACAANPDLFFSEEPDDIASAKAVCGSCPLADTCRESALNRREPFGVWGGQSPEERGTQPRAIRRQARRAANAEDRRNRVAELCLQMTPAEVAEVLAVPVKRIYTDRLSVGISRPQRDYTKTIGDVVRLRGRGVGIPDIATRMLVSERTVNRWIRKQRIEAAA